jgi:histidyl-tRNA synthetase
LRFSSNSFFLLSSSLSLSSLRLAIVSSLSFFFRATSKNHFGYWVKPTKMCFYLEFLENNEIRARVDNRSETIGKKIREAEISKVPFMAIIGEQEAAQETVSIRARGGNDLGSMSLASFANLIRRQAADEIKSF